MLRIHYADILHRSVEDMLKETVRKLHGFYYHSYQHSIDVARRHHQSNDAKEEAEQPQPLDGSASIAAVAATGLIYLTG